MTRLQALLQRAIEIAGSPLCKKALGYLDQRKVVLRVQGAFAFSALAICLPVGHAPNLDVPAVRQEVGAVRTSERDFRLNFMRDGMSKEPFINVALVAGRNKVAITALDVTLTAPSAFAYRDSVCLAERPNDATAYAESPGNSLDGHACVVQGFELGFCRQNRLVSIATGFPDCRKRNAVLLEPERYGGVVHVIQRCNLAVSHVFVVHQSDEIISRWSHHPAIVQPAIGRTSRNVLSNEPTQYFGLANTIARTNRAGRHSLRLVQAQERFSVRSHADYSARIAPYVEFGT